MDRGCSSSATAMTVATGNIYCGLRDFVDMAFRPDNLFVDVGTYIASYSVLARSRLRHLSEIPAS
jgi:hypothetical protein